MGCGESKHVATGNTISRKNSRAGSTIEEARKLDSKEEGKNVNEDSGAGNSMAVVADGKGIAESTDKENKNGGVKENEESIEGIAFEGISGRSEDYSQQEEAGKERLSNENVRQADGLEDKKLSEETKEETVKDNELAQETKFETKKENLEDKELAEEKKEETANDL